jgi:hypothetical protein
MIAQAPVVYFDFLSHNEDTQQWSVSGFYNSNRTQIMNLANYFQANGMTWNMQSDYTYLNGVLSLETPALEATTNNKNILRWMHEDKGVEMDPHSHENVYLYPDVVKLMDSIGLPTSEVIGGSIYNDSNGINIWTNLINGQYGVIFPNYFWQPQYLMGGGTPNHVADLKYFGFWNPTDTANYLVNNPASPLHHIGTGCEIKIKNDTTSVATIVAEIRDVISNVQAGNYPSNGIYFQSVFFEQADLNNAAFYSKVLQIADSMNAMVATGQAQWKTFSQVYTIWENNFASQPFQWECGQMSTGIENNVTRTGISIYPNPATNEIVLDNYSANSLSEQEITIYDALGKMVYSSNSSEAKTEINVASFTSGIYFVHVKNGNDIYSEKFLKE